MYELGEVKLQGVLQKKFKIAFTYLHWERVKLHPKSEMFTKDSKSPLIMFALGEAEFGIISEKFFEKTFLLTVKVPSQIQNHSLFLTS